ncbi:MAG: zf-HC2 domain-containing protein [Myxococcales bacterium]|nr:zf-HC2 domain-containing protein [Myxococcales bacterium]
MKCEAIQKLLPALAGGDLDRSQAAVCERHVAACAACADRLAGLTQTLRLLRTVGQNEPLPAHFRVALHRRLAQTPPPSPTLTARLWRLAESLRIDSAPRLLLVGAAAVLLIAVPVGWRERGPAGGGSIAANGGPASSGSPSSAEQEVAASFRVPAQRTAVLRFDFVADVEVPDVEFEVTLPSELFFVDGAEPVPEKRLVWRGSLSSGSNPIPLAVRGSKPGRYRVTAHARGEGVDVKHDILLEVVRS